MMDIPSSTPRRNPPRNLPNPPQQHHPEPYGSSSDKHPSDNRNENRNSVHGPPLHRSTNRGGNLSWDPQPSDEWRTPNASPIKNGGSAHLLELFDRNLQLTPSSLSSVVSSNASNVSSNMSTHTTVKVPSTPAKRSTVPREDELAATVSRGHGEERPMRHRRIKKENAPTEELQRQPRVEPSTGYSRSTRGKYDPFRDMTVDEIEKLSKPSVKRLKDVAHLYFYDYYYNLVTYVHTRQERTSQWKEANQNLRPDEMAQQWRRFAGRERVALRKRRTRLRKGDFHLLTQVGQGGYGQVYLAEHNDTKEVCALKVMSKKLLFKLDEIRHVLTERDILTAAKSEWLVKLLYAFQDEDSIYLAMEYVPGGDFRTLLNNTGVLHFNHARFYISEMFVSVSALHDLGYIHRDLKPENFLIDSSGHIKLTDFGLSAGKLAPERMESMRLRLDQVKDMAIPERSTMERRNAYRTLRDNDVNYAKSVVGSPDYMAPEVLRGEEYDFTVDYWSLGCMLYEALAGYPPFAGATVDETWHNLKHWRKTLHKPEYENPNYFLSKRTWDFITHLVASRTSRFPNFKEVQAHAYFSEVNFAELRKKDPPFVPELDSETDAGYFDDFGNEADMAKYKEVHDKQMALESMADRGEKMNKSAFLGFTFKHKKHAEDLKQLHAQQTANDEGDFGTIF